MDLGKIVYPIIEEVPEFHRCSQPSLAQTDLQGFRPSGLLQDIPYHGIDPLPVRASQLFYTIRGNIPRRDQRSPEGII
jgi:hypothetical protein